MQIFNFRYSGLTIFYKLLYVITGGSRTAATSKMELFVIIVNDFIHEYVKI